MNKFNIGDKVSYNDNLEDIKRIGVVVDFEYVGDRTKDTDYFYYISHDKNKSDKEYECVIAHKKEQNIEKVKNE
jgi:hypothetical protein